MVLYTWMVTGRHKRKLRSIVVAKWATSPILVLCLTLPTVGQPKVKVSTPVREITLVGKTANYMFMFEANDRVVGRLERFELRIRAKSIVSLRIHQGKLLVVGQLSHGGDIITVVDLRSHEILDTLWAYQLVFSKTGRHAAFIQHFPRFPPRGSFRRYVVNIYDFSKTPRENRLAQAEDGDPRVGIPVFPEEDLGATRNRLFVDRPSDSNLLTSPLHWVEDDQKLLFTEWRRETNYLILVELNFEQGMPRITRKEITPEISDDVARKVTENITVKRIVIEGDLLRLFLYRSYPGIQKREIRIDKKAIGL